MACARLHVLDTKKLEHVNRQLPSQLVTLFGKRSAQFVKTVFVANSKTQCWMFASRSLDISKNIDCA